MKSNSTIQPYYNFDDIPQLVESFFKHKEIIDKKIYDSFNCYIDELSKIASRELFEYESLMNVPVDFMGKKLFLDFNARFYDEIRKTSPYLFKKVVYFVYEGEEVKCNLHEQPDVWDEYFDEIKEWYFFLPSPTLKALYIEYISNNIYNTGDKNKTDKCNTLLAEFKNEIRDGVSYKPSDYTKPIKEWFTNVFNHLDSVNDDDFKDNTSSLLSNLILDASDDRIEFDAQKRKRASGQPDNFNCYVARLYLTYNKKYFNLKQCTFAKIFSIKTDELSRQLKLLDKDKSIRKSWKRQ